MRKNSGQALVEFVIILPILLLILMGIIDFGNIIYKKYNLESCLDTVVFLYENNKQEELNDYLLNEKINVTYEDDIKFTKIIIDKDVETITPGLNLILNSPYNIKTERTIYHE